MLLLLPAFVVAPAASAAPPAVTATASVPAGQAPLTVTLTASGDAASYHWDLGDGTSADGASVQHVYATGLWTATVTATAADGETAQAHVDIRSETVTLAAHNPATYGRIAVFTGSLRPAAPAVAVTLTAAGRTLGHGTTGPGGGFRIHARAGAPGAVVAHADQAASQQFQLAVRPAVTVTFTGKPALYGKLNAVARIQPASAGTLAVTVRRSGTVVKTLSGDTVNVPVDTSRPGSVVVTANAKAAAGWLPANTSATTTIAYPQLAEGATGAASRSSTAGSPHSATSSRRRAARSTAACSTPSTPSRRCRASTAPASSLLRSGRSSTTRCGRSRATPSPPTTSR